MNVVPSELIAYFDIRVNPWVDAAEMEEEVLSWCRDSGDGVQLDFIVEKPKEQTLTSTQAGNLW